MNNVVIMGRLTKDPEIRYSQGENPMCVARYTLAVDRPFAKDGEQTADFISCKAFGKAGQFIEKYAKKGTKLAVKGRIQTGSYTNKDGQKVYTTEVVAEAQEFAESKKAAEGGNSGASSNAPASAADDGFMNVPDELDDDLPFN